MTEQTNQFKFWRKSNLPSLFDMAMVNFPCRLEETVLCILCLYLSKQTYYSSPSVPSINRETRQIWNLLKAVSQFLEPWHFRSIQTFWKHFGAFGRLTTFFRVFYILMSSAASLPCSPSDWDISNLNIRAVCELQTIYLHDNCHYGGTR